jgi:O-antigen/teichoic acid export membrane protein
MWIFMKKPWLFTIFNSANIFMELGVAVVLVVILGVNWQGRVWGIFVSRLVLFIIAVCVLLKYNFLRVSFNKIYMKNILSFGFPVALHSLGFAVIAAIDRFFIEKFINISSAGIYSASYSICSMIGFISGAFNLAWAPVFYEKLKNLSAVSKDKLVKYTYLCFIVIILGVISFIKFIPAILHILVGSKFLGVSAFIPWIALGFGFHSMYVMVVNYIFYAKETKILSKIAFITVILSFVSNYILIKINGAIGVAQATCLVFLIRFLLVWFFSNKVYPMPWFSFARIKVGYLK